MAKLRTTSEKGTYIFICPGCDEEHQIWSNENETRNLRWDFNGDLEHPTFNPSLLINRGRVNPTRHICHSFIKDGKIQYLNDCTHHLAGQTIEIPDIQKAP